MASLVNQWALQFMRAFRRSNKFPGGPKAWAIAGTKEEANHFSVNRDLELRPENALLQIR
jgi:hypothetical protein